MDVVWTVGDDDKSAGGKDWRGAWLQTIRRRWRCIVEGGGEGQEIERTRDRFAQYRKNKEAHLLVPIRKRYNDSCHARQTTGLRLEALFVHPSLFLVQNPSSKDRQPFGSQLPACLLVGLKVSSLFMKEDIAFIMPTV